jgi:hypothetical protein
MVPGKLSASLELEPFCLPGSKQNFYFFQRSLNIFLWVDCLERAFPELPTIQSQEGSLTVFI